MVLFGTTITTSLLYVFYEENYISVPCVEIVWVRCGICVESVWTSVESVWNPSGTVWKLGGTVWNNVEISYFVN